MQDSPNLQTSLANMFTFHEHLVGENQYRCSTCANTLCDAEKVKEMRTKHKYIILSFVLYYSGLK